MNWEETEWGKKFMDENQKKLKGYIFHCSYPQELAKEIKKIKKIFPKAIEQDEWQVYIEVPSDARHAYQTLIKALKLADDISYCTKIEVNESQGLINFSFPDHIDNDADL